MRVTFPLGMQLRYGTRLIVDGSDPRQSPFVEMHRCGLRV